MGEVRSVYCDDCGREKMAEVRDGKIVIVDRRHGRASCGGDTVGAGRGREGERVSGIMRDRIG